MSIGHELDNIRQAGHANKDDNTAKKTENKDDFVLEKTIFNNVFQKDIRRIFIYKKIERLAKAIHLISPAFDGSVSFKNRMDAIAIGLVDAGVLPTASARQLLSRDLLALSSLLSMARTGGMLSPMNADLIIGEAHSLLREIASYEEPRVSVDSALTLSDIARNVSKREAMRAVKDRSLSIRHEASTTASQEGIKDIKDTGFKDRREYILSVIRDKKSASIKDISTLIRDVSEKTIQRELASLVTAGVVSKHGERRWSTYSLVQGS